MPETLAPDTERRIIRIQALTLVWMTMEAAVSLGAAWAARSPALLSFGGDGAVELLSAAAALRRFRGRSPQAHAEEKIAGALLFVLAAFVLLASTLSLLGLHAEPRPSWVRIVLVILTAVVMPWPARQKRLLSVVTGSERYERTPQSQQSADILL